MMATHVGITVAGLNFFEVVTILFTIVLAFIALSSAFKNKANVRMSMTERWMLAFIIWASLVTLFYYDIADFKTYVKWVLPMITFMILRRGIQSDIQYKNLIGLMIVGFTLPVGLSTYMIAKGIQVGKEVYWTGLERYHGAYASIHDMGHSMALLFVSMTIFVLVSKTVSAKRTKALIVGRNILFVIMGLMACYCLYKAQVRTAYVGIFVFIVVFLYLYSKKGLAVFGGIFVASLVVFGSIYYTIFFDIIDSVKGERAAAEAGSGRIAIWTHNWDIYSELPLHRKVMGIGIGNKHGTATWKDSDIKEQAWDSHSDWIQVFMATGPLGLVFMVGIFVSLFKSILRIPGREKYAYIAFFASVVVMNAASNSYFARFPLAQMFYMIMVYAEFPRRNRKESVIENEVVITTKPPRVIYKQRNIQ